MVSARDFVYISKKGYNGKVFSMGGRSVEFKDAPAQGRIVRAYNGPGCQMVLPSSGDSCDFVWLMDCDYKVLPCLLIKKYNMITLLGMDASEYSRCCLAFRPNSTYRKHKETCRKTQKRRKILSSFHDFCFLIKH